MSTIITFTKYFLYEIRLDTLNYTNWFHFKQLSITGEIDLSKSNLLKDFVSLYLLDISSANCAHVFAETRERLVPKAG